MYVMMFQKQIHPSVSCSMLLSHEDLVLELPKLEKLNASERKKLNDNRRAAQLERWKKSQSEGMCFNKSSSFV